MIFILASFAFARHQRAITRLSPGKLGIMTFLTKHKNAAATATSLLSHRRARTSLYAISRLMGHHRKLAASTGQGINASYIASERILPLAVDNARG